MDDVLVIFFRWLHISSMAALVGGMLYGRAVESQARRSGSPLSGQAATAYRPVVLYAVVGLVMSGMFNILMNPGYSRRYHILLGVKILLALHVFAVAFLSTRPDNPRRQRMMTGASLSGLIIIAISAYIRIFK